MEYLPHYIGKSNHHHDGGYKVAAQINECVICSEGKGRKQAKEMSCACYAMKKTNKNWFVSVGSHRFRMWVLGLPHMHMQMGMSVGAIVRFVKVFVLMDYHVICRQ